MMFDSRTSAEEPESEAIDSGNEPEPGRNAVHLSLMKF